jgi:hypothetical protein
MHQNAFPISMHVSGMAHLILLDALNLVIYGEEYKL